MFSKYTDMEIPKNYSGNRFNRSTLNTKMKTHKPPEPVSTPISIKSATSPSFQELVDRTAKEAQGVNTENTKYTNKGYDGEDVDKNSNAVNAQDLPKQDIATHNVSKTNELDFFNLLKSSGIGKLFENKSSDDILLIALISLLAAEGRGENIEVILILSLLLLLH